MGERVEESGRAWSGFQFLEPSQRDDNPPFHLLCVPNPIPARRPLCMEYRKQR